MRSDLISREVLLSEYDNNFVRYKDFRDFLENVPDVEIRDSLFVNGYAQGYEDAKAKFERPQGEWIKVKKDRMSVDMSGELVTRYKCSKCGRYIVTLPSKLVDYPFCHCGADMRGKEE